MSNQDFCIDYFFTKEIVALPDVIVEDPIEDIKAILKMFIKLITMSIKLTVPPMVLV